MHPFHPSQLFPSFQIHLWGDFPMLRDLSSSPMSPLLHDLGDTPRLPHFPSVFFDGNVRICKETWTLELATFPPSCEALTIALALEPAQCLIISVTMESCICSAKYTLSFTSTMSCTIIGSVQPPPGITPHTQQLATELGFELASAIVYVSVPGEVHFHTEGQLMPFATMLNISVKFTFSQIDFLKLKTKTKLSCLTLVVISNTDTTNGLGLQM